MLKDIANETEKKLDDIMHSSLSVESINFKCNGCGACCKNRGDIFLSPLDIYYICRYLNISLNTFMDTYVVKDSILLYIKDKGDPEKTCAFYGTQIGCMIHPVKPKTCYMFPFLELDDNKFRVQLIPCVLENNPFISKKTIKEILINNSCRYEPEKEILNKYLLLFNEFFEKIYEYFQKGIDTKPAENFFFDTFFSNIDLKLDENKFLEWFQEQIVVAEDALIMM